MATLTLYPEEYSKAIKLVLMGKKKGENWEEVASTGDDLIQTLDKVLKKANIDLNSLTAITLSRKPWGSITSRRLATVFQQALYIAISTKPKKT